MGSQKSGAAHNSLGQGAYTKSQLDTIREQLMRASTDNSHKPAAFQVDEDEEFKMAEDLAASFNLTEASNSISKKELDIALQRSFKQLEEE